MNPFSVLVYIDLQLQSEFFFFSFFILGLDGTIQRKSLAITAIWSDQK